MQKQEGLKVEAGKSFPVSAQELYNAWTNPDTLKQWWKPMGNSLQEVINDIRQGGTVKYIFENNALIISGEYLEVKENEKLVYTWNWNLPNDPVRNADYLLTVEFKNNGDSSELKVVQENFENEEALHPHTEGWQKGLSELEMFLRGGSAGTSSQSEKSTAAEQESGGYRETPEQVKVGGA